MCTQILDTEKCRYEPIVLRMRMKDFYDLQMDAGRNTSSADMRHGNKYSPTIYRKLFLLKALGLVYPEREICSYN